MSTIEQFDAIVIGAGIAGLAATVWPSRRSSAQ